MATVAETSPGVDLVRAADTLMAASKAMGGFMEIILSLPDDRKITLTRGKLYNLLAPVENGLIDAQLKVNQARKKID